MHRFIPRAGAVVALVGLLSFAGSPALAEATLQGVVNVNTATTAELELLPGIGASRAEAVIAAREEGGGFTSLDELLEVKGIGEASLAKLRPHLVLEGETTARRE
jgi:competence protein ComEA